MVNSLTGLIAPVDTASTQIQAFRNAYVLAPSVIMPLHITVCAPFIGHEKITLDLDAAIGQFLATYAPFQVILSEISWCAEKGTVFILPDSDDALLSLQSAIASRFADACACNKERRMHMTLADGQPAECLPQIASSFLIRYGHLLPLLADIRSLDVYDKVNGAWAKRRTYALYN